MLQALKRLGPKPGSERRAAGSGRNKGGKGKGGGERKRERAEDITGYRLEDEEGDRKAHEKRKQRPRWEISEEAARGEEAEEEERQRLFDQLTEDAMTLMDAGEIGEDSLRDVDTVN